MWAIARAETLRLQNPDKKRKNVVERGTNPDFNPG